LRLCCGCCLLSYTGRKLANELGFLQLRPTIIYEDNLGAKQIAESGNFEKRSKHFELGWRFLHHYINRGIVSIKAIKRELQLADLATAPRGYPQLQQMGAVIDGEI
jgi:hypothetical protein